MGVSTNFYTYYGIQIPWNNKFYEVYDEKYDDIHSDIIVDGMGGNYMIFGVCLFDSGDYRWGFEDGDTFKEIDLKNLPSLEAEYKVLFKAEFPEFYHIIDQPFKLMSFVHFS